jgi:FkbM family methyltransferase
MNHWIARLRWIHRAWRYRLSAERAEVAWVLRRLRPGDAAVDIGAHKGAFTYWMARRVGAAGKVYAFEPQPALTEGLRELVASAGLSQVIVEGAALSCRSGEVSLRVPNSDGKVSPGASCEPRHPERLYHDYVVPAKTLDEYFSAPNSPRVRLIKCDAEGHELSVFQGSESLLRRDQPDLLFECEACHRANSSVREVFDYLSSLGYEGFFFLKSRLTPIVQFDERRHQASRTTSGYCNNFLFLSAEASAAIGAGARRGKAA